MGYGITEETNMDSNTGSFHVGINENVKLESVEFQKVATKDGGEVEVLDFNYTNDEGGSIRDRIFPITKAFPKDKWVDGKVVGQETEEEAMQRAFKEFNTKMLHIGHVFVDKEKLITATKGVKTFSDFAKAYVKTLGTKYPEVNLRLKLHYKWKSKFFKVPTTLKFGPFIEDQDANPTSTFRISDWEKDNMLTSHEEQPENSETVVNTAGTGVKWG